MKFLSAYGIKAEYFDSNNFKILLEKEINMRNWKNSATPTYLCGNHPHLLDHDMFTTMFEQ